MYPFVGRSSLMDYLIALSVILTTLSNLSSGQAQDVTFLNTPYAVGITENAPNETFLFEVKAVGDMPGAIKYTFGEMSEKYFSSIFYFNESDGRISIIGNLDHEVYKGIVLQVRAEIVGRPQGRGATTVNVTVLDVNDNAPTFSQSSYNFSAKKDDMMGQAIGNVTATDNDDGVNAQLTYRLKDDSPYAWVDQNNGTIYVYNSLNVTSFQLIVIAEDQGQPPLSSTTTISVTVTPGISSNPTPTTILTAIMSSSGGTGINSQAPTPTSAISAQPQLDSSSQVLPTTTTGKPTRPPVPTTKPGSIVIPVASAAGIFALVLGVGLAAGIRN